jgi:hypothetical protein
MRQPLMTEPEDLAWRIEKPPGERRAEVIVNRSRSGATRLQTEPDDIKENNLSSLPQCR